MIDNIANLNREKDFGSILLASGFNDAASIHFVF